MNQLSVAHQIAAREHISTHQPEAEWGLKVACLYQHDWNRQRAEEVRQRVEQVAGKDAVCFDSWSLADLDDSAKFAEASWRATDADVIVVAIDAAEELPPEFYVWIDIWLPRRCQTTGAFIALLNVPANPRESSVRTQAYLEAVARQGGLNFLIEERRVPMAVFEPAQRPLQTLDAA
jgi:hypothetical protein